MRSPESKTSADSWSRLHRDCADGIAPTDSGSSISAIVLAAGESRRMGRPKLLLPLGGSTVLGETVRNLADSRLDQVIVVLGCRARELTAAVSSYPVTVVLNRHYRRGMSTSVVAGLGGVSRSAAAVMVALGDQPFVSPDIIRRLVAGFRAGGKGIVVPVYRGRRGHPVIFAAKYRDELAKLTGDEGGRDIINRHPEDVLEVPVDSDSVVRDIDTPDDYAPHVRLSSGSARTGKSART